MMERPCATCAHNRVAVSATIQGVTSPPSETQRVAADLARKIRDMRSGDEVGSVRSLAATYEVSADVARKALALLARHGLVRAEARRHVVADPNAPMSDAELLADLLRRVEALERWQAGSTE